LGDVGAATCARVCVCVSARDAERDKIAREFNLFKVWKCGSVDGVNARDAERD
jgi:hypothetical protein